MTAQLIPEGFTKHILGRDWTGSTFNLYVKPHTDLTSRFQAWDADYAEWLMVNGWMGAFEVLED